MTPRKGILKIANSEESLISAGENISTRGLKITDETVLKEFRNSMDQLPQMNSTTVDINQEKRNLNYNSSDELFEYSFDF